ncbi:hypothetical protein K438DRAFT_1767002 [Mycena galopus ATCC 62051]|nr:hypothetical protein K438DRAFT_1767002 [Mycena galopus ATCC 62051]
MPIMQAQECKFRPIPQLGHQIRNQIPSVPDVKLSGCLIFLFKVGLILEPQTRQEKGKNAKANGLHMTLALNQGAHLKLLHAIPLMIRGLKEQMYCPVKLSDKGALVKLKAASPDRQAKTAKNLPNFSKESWPSPESNQESHVSFGLDGPHGS